MFPIFTLAQVPPMTTPAPQEIIQNNPVRSLPGKLDKVPVFNSNSPEQVLQEGILLSTFPAEGKTNAQAHLNYPLQGYFDVFAHHVAKAPTPENQRTLYLGIILHNPTKKTVTVNITQAASYLSQPDAPFVELPPQVDNLEGKVYAGPGDKVMGDILRGKHQDIFPQQLVIAPSSSKMLLNLPIPIKGLEPPLNGRSSYLRLYSDGEVYAASMAMFAPTDDAKQERSPSLQEWENLLAIGNLVTPRDRTPTPPNVTTNVVYGRVAGISQGAKWQGNLTDNPQSSTLTIPDRGKAISWVLSTLAGGTLGTKQVQSAPMLARYPDTAYQAHGNYGVEYSLTIPLHNPTNQAQKVSLSLQTPIKQEELTGGLRFLEPLPKQVFFRGTVKLSYSDEKGLLQTRYLHLVQKRGQRGENLLNVTIPPQNRNLVKIEFLYPPDATPPQAITLETL
jgi:Protein of unknown function (DUF3370)